MWGQAIGGEVLGALIRIIPTRVGTSGFISQNRVQPEDHPHACGDKRMDVWILCASRGSSPRVWGQVIGQHGQVTAAGIIPTRVGTSVRISSRKTAS